MTKVGTRSRDWIAPSDHEQLVRLTEGFASRMLSKLQTKEVTKDELGHLALFLRVAGTTLQRPAWLDAAASLLHFSEFISFHVPFDRVSLIHHPVGNIIAQACAPVNGLDEKRCQLLLGKIGQQLASSTLPESQYELLSGILPIGIILNSMFVSDSPVVKQLESMLVQLQGHWGFPCSTANAPVMGDTRDIIFNLGTAHGLNGVLLYAIHYGHRELAEKLLPLLLELNLNPDISPPATFWPRSDFLQAGLDFHRSGWCYGHITVAYAMLLFAHHFPDSPLAAAASTTGGQLMEMSIQREKLAARGLSFCHGISGVAQICLRASELQDGPSSVREAAVFFLRKIFDEMEKGFTSCETSPYIRNNVLNNETGLHLVLLSFLTPEDRAWDRIFLLSKG